MRNLIQETIVAQATPPGRGGIAIVRVSGPRVKDIMTNVLGHELLPRQATFLPFRDEMGATLDEGVAIFFPGPYSFTGEDVLELHGHGGPIVVDLLLQRILKLETRLARPGEFSERAFLNNKLDLTQAEAIADLIDASSTEAARCAMRSLQGEFSKQINILNEQIIYLRLYVEAAIDFSEEDIDFLNDTTIRTKLDAILTQLSSIQSQAKQGSFLREGITVVIAGEPNVGKSSLLNCLSGKEIAIVTDIPGTTRDVLRDQLFIDGVPLHVIDTAGLRDTQDIVEQEGIRRAHEEIKQADLLLYMIDASHPQSTNVTDLLAKYTSCPIVFIRNKIDLIQEEPSLQVNDNHAIISLSAKLGLGITHLKNHIKSQIGFHQGTEGIFLARRRHLEALQRTHVYIEAAVKQFTMKAAELAAEELRQAQQALSEVTGKFTTEDLLGRIFSSFCVGK